MEKNTTIERIQRMEQCFDQLQEAVQRDPTAIAHDPMLQKLLSELLDYYEGGQWLRDYELDERGGLPVGLKRGVLSQDAVFDFLTEIVDIRE